MINIDGPMVSGSIENCCYNDMPVRRKALSAAVSPGIERIRRLRAICVSALTDLCVIKRRSFIISLHEKVALLAPARIG